MNKRNENINKNEKRKSKTNLNRGKDTKDKIINSLINKTHKRIEKLMTTD